MRNWETQPACLHHDDDDKVEEDYNDDYYHHDYFQVKDNIEGVDVRFIDDEIQDHVDFDNKKLMMRIMIMIL